MSTTIKNETTLAPQMPVLLLSATQAARFLGIGKSLFYSLHSSGELGPLPVTLSTKKLWRRAELEEWVAAGNCQKRTGSRSKRAQSHKGPANRRR